MDVEPMPGPVLAPAQRGPAIHALMIPHVLLQRVGVHVALRAVRAGEGFVRLVDTRVDVQPALVDKGFVALLAAVGADGDVKLQVALHREAFAAVGAHERVLVDVNPGVVLQKKSKLGC